MSNGVPKFLRLKNLEERGIAKTHQAVRHMQIHHGFPLGRLLGPGTKSGPKTRLTNGWQAGRWRSLSRPAGARRRSIEARRANGKLHTARQMLHGAA